MAKIIKYKFVVGEKNTGTELSPNIEQIIADKEMECKTQSCFESNLPIAEKEAIPGTIEVSGEFEPEQDTASADDVLNALLGVTE